MKNETIKIRKYVADEGKVFDYATPKIEKIINPETKIEEEIKEHLYAKEIYLAIDDDITNYIEVKKND